MIFLNIIILEVAVIWFIFVWDEEVINFLINLIFNIQISWLLFTTSVLWIFYVGSKHYTIMYTKGEDDEIYEIEFPSIKLK